MRLQSAAALCTLLLVTTCAAEPLASDVVRTEADAVRIWREKCKDDPDPEIHGTWSATLKDGLWHVGFWSDDPKEHCNPLRSGDVDAATGNQMHCLECVLVD